MAGVEIGDTVEFLDDDHMGDQRLGTVLVVYAHAITVEFSDDHREVYELDKLKISKDKFNHNWIVDWINK